VAANSERSAATFSKSPSKAIIPVPTLLSITICRWR
jgi:hypothetical protein